MIKNKIIYNSFSEYQFKISKAKDSYIWDENGKKLIDFTSGWNVTNLGWNNKEVNDAITKQAKKIFILRCGSPIPSKKNTLKN